MEVYWNWDGAPRRPYRRVARVEVAGRGGVDHLVEALAQQAASCGASAVIDVEQQHTVTVHGYGATQPHRVLSGTAVYWLEPERRRVSSKVFGWDE